MKCINLGELLEYEAKLKVYMMLYMRENVPVQYVDYDNEEEVMRQHINTFHKIIFKLK